MYVLYDMSYMVLGYDIATSSYKQVKTFFNGDMIFVNKLT